MTSDPVYVVSKVNEIFCKKQCHLLSNLGWQTNKGQCKIQGMEKLEQGVKGR